MAYFPGYARSLETFYMSGINFPGIHNVAQALAEHLGIPLRPYRAPESFRVPRDEDRACVKLERLHYEVQ